MIPREEDTGSSFRGEGNDSKNNSNNIMAPMTADYNSLNLSQSTVWKFVQPFFAKALQDATRNNNLSSFRVADWGCATGGNSVAPLQFVWKQLQQSQSSHCPFMEVFLGDLPQNAWTSVVTTVTPESITLFADNYPNHDTYDAKKRTFVYMVGKTFYEECVPPRSLDLSYSLVAVHWMKSYAGDLPSGLYATDPLHVPQTQLLQAWQQAGHRDWMDFCRCRHRELKVGGHFIGAVACPKENGDYPWSKVGYALYQALIDKVPTQDLDLLASMVLPVCWRTQADVLQGFSQPEGGWEVQMCEFHQTKDPVREQFERGELSSQEYGKAVVESFKAVCHQTCVQSMAKAMPGSQVVAILNDAYQDVAERVAADPEQCNLDVSFWYILVKKISD